MAKIKDLPKKLQKICSCCSKEIKVFLYKDQTYRGGHYFGKLKLDKKRIEYWECPKCYW